MVGTEPFWSSMAVEPLCLEFAPYLFRVPALFQCSLAIPSANVDYVKYLTSFPVCFRVGEVDLYLLIERFVQMCS